MVKDIVYKDKVYTVTDEQPKTGDQVLTTNYGVWEFHEGTAPLPYWCNANTCQKILAVNELQR